MKTLMLYFLPFSGNLVLYCFERIRELALTRAFRSVSCYIVLNVWSMYSARSLTGFTVRESILLDRMHNASAVCKWLMNHVFRCLSETDSALRRFVFFSFADIDLFYHKLQCRVAVLYTHHRC